MGTFHTEPPAPPKIIVSENEKMICYAIAIARGIKINIETDAPINRLESSVVIGCLESLKDKKLIDYKWVGILLEASLLVDFNKIDVDRSAKSVIGRMTNEGNTERAKLKPFLTPSKPINPNEYSFLDLRNKMSENIDWASLKLQELDYSEYLQTPFWQILSYRVKQDNGFSCVMCNSKESLNCHHRTYPRRGTEILNHLSILTCLCDACHSLHHMVEHAKN